MSGAFFETSVVAEVIKSYLNSGKRPPVLNKTGKETSEGSVICMADLEVPSEENIDA